MYAALTVEVEKASVGMPMLVAELKLSMLNDWGETSAGPTRADKVPSTATAKSIIGWDQLGEAAESGKAILVP